MEDGKIGAAFRAVRTRKGTTQREVAKVARVTQSDISRLERGQLALLKLETIRRVASVLEMWLDITPRWRGAGIDRILNHAHAALQGSVLDRFRDLAGWTALPEVSFSIRGERGAIDILAWHAETRTLLIVELKTILVEPAELVRTMGQRQRLASEIAKWQGWSPRAVGRWVILTDTRTNRRHVSAHASVLAPLMVADGVRMRRWLREPAGSISALSFWRQPDGVVAMRIGTKRRCTSRPPSAAGASDRLASGDSSPHRPAEEATA
jgi:transcriptional regulator with XRE-family HTH domain